MLSITASNARPRSCSSDVELARSPFTWPTFPHHSGRVLPREKTVTSSPRVSNCSTIARPKKVVPPSTRTFMLPLALVEDELLGVLLESVLAPRPTEVVGLALVFRRPFRCRFLDLHLADRICRHAVSFRPTYGTASAHCDAPSRGRHRGKEGRVWGQAPVPKAVPVPKPPPMRPPVSYTHLT